MAQVGTVIKLFHGSSGGPHRFRPARLADINVDFSLVPVSIRSQYCRLCGQGNDFLTLAIFYGAVVAGRTINGTPR